MIRLRADVNKNFNCVIEKKYYDKMSTTVVETSPVWVYKLFSQNSAATGQNPNVPPAVCKTKQIIKEQEDVLPIKQQLFFGRGLAADKLCASATGSVLSTGPTNTYTKLMNRSLACGDIYLENNKFDSMICSYLYKIREPLASYQEKRGLPRETEHSFIGLMTTLCQASYHAVLTILTMIVNLVPLYEGFLYLCRFLIDKLIEIFEAPTGKERALKTVIFIAEFIILCLVIMLMFCLIIIPIWQLLSYILGKAWNLLFSSNN